MFTLCYRMVGNYFEAQDLTQETFLSAWSALDRFDGQHEKAWLCRIAANKCTDFLRRRRLQLVPDGEEALPWVPDAAPDPERQVLEQEVQEELRCACETLKEPYRSTALLYFVEERSFQEIAIFVAKRLSPLDDVLSTATSFVLRPYKRGGRLYLPEEPDERECTVL